jgi:septal ring factor EnvC (AmiA/AmiB activator)
MFFQGIISILIILGFLFVVWKLIVKPVLEDHGIKVDDEPEVKTEYTKRLDKTKKEHTEKFASVDAIRKEKELKKDIKYMDNEIDETEKQIEDESDK